MSAPDEQNKLIPEVAVTTFACDQGDTFPAPRKVPITRETFDRLRAKNPTLVARTATEAWLEGKHCVDYKGAPPWQVRVLLWLVGKGWLKRKDLLIAIGKHDLLERGEKKGWSAALAITGGVVPGKESKAWQSSASLLPKWHKMTDGEKELQLKELGLLDK